MAYMSFSRVEAMSAMSRRRATPPSGHNGSVASVGGESRAAGLAWWVRPFVYGLLTVFVTCALLGLEWWPFTGWRLFSHLRTGTTSGFVSMSVDRAGNEHVLAAGAQPETRPYERLVTRMWAYEPARRRALCEGLAREADRTGDVQGVRIYRVVRAVPRRGERRGAEVGRSRIVSCRVPM